MTVRKDGIPTVVFRQLADYSLGMTGGEKWRKSNFMLNIQYLKHFFRLSWILAKMKFKLKNEGSYLGVLWYLLNPLLTFLLLFFIFHDRLGREIEKYPLYLFLGIIMFNFFQQVTSESSWAIKENAGLIKSIAFPREALIGAIVINNLFSHLIELVVFLAIAIIFKGLAVGVIFYFILLLFFCIFNFGVGLFLASISAYFTDLQNIWSFFVRLLWFGTPIFYIIAGQNRLFTINLFNPMYYFIEIGRNLAVYDQLPALWLIAGLAGFTLASLIVGFFTFQKLKNKFAEMI